jgi:hydrogenase expression/formation protein HypC
MCLGIPAKIIQVDGEFAVVSIDGARLRIGLQLVEDIKEGDYVLVHTGYALEKLNEEEARETLRMIKEIDSMDPEKREQRK